MPPQESIEIMRQSQDPSKAEIEAMNAAARQQMAESAAQFDSLLNRQLVSTDVETVVDQQLDIQKGADNQVFGIDGAPVTKNNTEEVEDIAHGYDALSDGVGQKERINRLAQSMHDVTKTILSEYGIEPAETNVGKGGTAAEVVLLSEAARDMNRAGGAKELDPTGNRARKVQQQDIGLQVIRAVDKNPGQLREIADGDPVKAQQIAEAVTAYRQNGNVNPLTTQALGRTLEGDRELPTAA